MAAQLDPNVKDDLKTQFITREGTYRLMTLSEYSTNRPNRVGYTNSQGSPQVRVSIVTLPNPTGSGGLHGGACSSNGPMLAGGSNGLGDSERGQQSQYAVPATLDARLGAGMSMHTMMNGGGGMEQNGLGSQYYGGDRICFNFGRELYVYAFRGVKKGSELSKPIDKKFYKGTNPSCHDFNATTASPSGAPLLVGFTTGQIQLVSPQPGPRELRKLYNEERLIDKTKVTCLKWLPSSPNLFLASHASGHLYLYNEELPCTPTAPNYQPFKMGDGFTILTCKSKSTRNPLYKWVFSTDNCCINEFCFSPCGSNLAIVSQDGFLRVFHYDTMELLGIARSYFGGFLCVCWSPDGKYIVVGGEDDLVTVWSLHERRVVARGQGHRSWVSVVAFDPFTTSYTNWDGGDFSDDENQMGDYSGGARFSTDSTANGFDFMLNDKNSTPNHARQRPHSASFRSDISSSAALAPDKLAISYRLGSVSQDTQLCLWDITEDVLRHPLALRQRVNSLNDSTTHMNGGLDSEGVKLIRPIAIGNAAVASSSSSSYPPNQSNLSPTKDSATINNENSNSSSKHSTNSNSSKFSTANCTISSQSSSTTPQEDVAVGVLTTTNTNKSNSNNKTTGSAIKFPNCISGGTATKADVVDCSANHNMKLSSSSSTTSGYNSSLSAAPTQNSKQQSSSVATKSSDSSGGLSALNSITQRLSNFSFLSNSSGDKKSSLAADASHGGTTSHRNHRKTSSLLKSSNHSNSLFANSTTLDLTGIGSTSTAHSFGSLKMGKSSTNSHLLAAAAAASSNAIVTSYDPMKLIGTSACPRFDECPLLEPLICKKIAHERLTALIFREDCFLTACQDGFIYTWARPGYTTTVPQHMSPSPSAPPGGTVV